jgi:hypothetical protein
LIVQKVLAECFGRGHTDFLSVALISESFIGSRTGMPQESKRTPGLFTKFCGTKCLEKANLFTSYQRRFLRGPTKESDACIRRGTRPIHAMAARDATVFFGSLGTFVSPL